MPPKLQAPLFRKTYRTRESGRGVGILKGFMDLPMDVVFEVSLRSLQNVPVPVDAIDANATLFQTAMYLHPEDLLHLSRLSKQFRSMFASRSAIFVWQTAYRNAGKGWYEDLNEIQFASLMCDEFCMVNFSSFCTASYDLYICVFPSGMRTSHKGMRVILCASSETVSKLSNWEVRNLFSYL